MTWLQFGAACVGIWLLAQDLGAWLRAIRAGNAAVVGAIIDTQGCESLTFAIESGVITDGTHCIDAKRAEEEP